MQIIREIIFYVLCLAEYCAARWILLPQMTDLTVPWQERLRLWIPTLIEGMLFAYNGFGSFVSTSMLFFSTIVSGILFLLFHRKQMWRVMVWEVFSLTVLFLIKCMALIFEGLFLQMNMIEINYGARSWPETAVEAVLVVFLIRTGKLLQKQKISIATFCGRYWKWMLPGALAGEELMSFIMINSWSGMNVPMLVLNIVVILADIFLVLILLLLFILSQVKQERNIMVYQQHSTQEYYRELRRQHERMGKLNHDIRNERACLYHFLEEGEMEKAKAFLEEKQGESYTLHQIWTGDSMVDFMITLKKSEMVKRKISFQLDSDFTKFPTSQEDCCILMGNLLDNAIEAAEKCPEKDRWIRLELRQHNEIFWLMVKNASVQAPKIREGKFDTTKKEREIHGWGLQNVENLADKYGGTIKYDYSEKFFEVQITFWDIK